MAFIIYITVFAFYLAHMAPGVAVGDAGEFIAAAKILGVAHPPGYPLFSLLGKMAVVALPFGSAAFRVNVLSAAAGAGAAAIFFLALKQFLPRHGGLIPAAGTFLFAASFALVRSATQAEVFTLNALFAAAITLCLLRAAPTDDDRVPENASNPADRTKISVGARQGDTGTMRPIYLAAFLFGLAATNHQTIILMAPAAAVCLRRELPVILRRGAALALFFLAGFSANLYIPVRAVKSPPLNVGNAATPAAFARLLMRSDYGSLKLTAGEKKPYTPGVIARQTARAGAGIAKEFTAAGAALAAAGVTWLFWRRRSNAAFAATFYFFSVPFFIFAGNLPFDGESDGILERFYVMGNIPLAFFAAAGARAAGVYLKNNFWPAAGLLAIAVWGAAAARADYDWRDYYLAHDYGRNVLQSVSGGGALFMDGGDDTFYTTAYFVFAQKIRADVALFDRGGVVFKSPYGGDFRRLPKNEKEARRKAVEKHYAGARPVFFSTFNKDVMSPEKVAPAGVLYAAARAHGGHSGAAADFYEFYSLRNVYDDFSDYRSRALQPIYHYTEAAETLSGEKTRLLDYCMKRWPDVSWVRTNALVEFAQAAYGRFAAGDMAGAKKIYGKTVEHFPSDVGAWTNMGVIAEKTGDDEEALKCYNRAAEAQPEYAPAYYNAAVIYWKRGEWEKVAEFFGRVAAIEPDNARAREYLAAAQAKMRR